MGKFSQGAAERIKFLRERQKLNQADVAKAIGCTGGHISNVENDKAQLSLPELEKLAAFFKVHPLYLLAGITKDVTELVDLMTEMVSTKRVLALRLFKLNLEMMEISKNWPSDAVNKT